MFQWLQKYPHFLEIVYDLTDLSLRPFKRWLKPGGRMEKPFTAIEKAGKGSSFQLQDVWSMCLTQHRDDLPDELSQTSAQWTLWRCAPEWQL